MDAHMEVLLKGVKNPPYAGKVLKLILLNQWVPYRCGIKNRKHLNRWVI